jgi:hypothetical protein
MKFGMHQHTADPRHDPFFSAFREDSPGKILLARGSPLDRRPISTQYCVPNDWLNEIQDGRA